MILKLSAKIYAMTYLKLPCYAEAQTSPGEGTMQGGQEDYRKESQLAQLLQLPVVLAPATV